MWRDIALPVSAQLRDAISRGLAFECAISLEELQAALETELQRLKQGPITLDKMVSRTQEASAANSDSDSDSNSGSSVDDSSSSESFFDSSEDAAPETVAKADKGLYLRINP